MEVYQRAALCLGVLKDKMRPMKKFNDDARSLFIVTSVKGGHNLDESCIMVTWRTQRAENGGARKAKRFHNNTHMGFIRFVYFTSSEVNNLFRLLIKPRVQFKMLRSAFARNKIWTNIFAFLLFTIMTERGDAQHKRVKVSLRCTQYFYIYFWRLLRR